MGAEETAAHAQKGLLGRRDGLGNPLDLDIVALDAGLVAPDVHAVGVDGIDHLLLDVDGDVDEDGPLPAGGGDVEGLLDDAGDVVGVLHQVAVLGEGGAGAGDIHLLEDVPAQQVALDLAGDGHHGDRVHVGGGDAGDEVGGAGAGGHHTHSGLTRHAGVAGGHVTGILLGAHQGIGDVGGGQGVHGGADGGAGVTEDPLHTLAFETLHQDLGSVDHAAFLLEFQMGKLPAGSRLCWKMAADMQKDFVLSRTKSCSVVPPKFAGRRPRALFPDNGGEPSPPTAVQGRSSRATFSRPLTGAHTCRSLSALARPIYLPGHCCFCHIKM